MNKETYTVRKRDGSVEPIQLEKLHKMVDASCEGLAGVSASQVEVNSGIQFFDGITTEEIQTILIKSAHDLITPEEYNYQYVAARLLIYSIRKQWSQQNNIQWDKYSLYDHICKNVRELKTYDPLILKNYSEDEITAAGEWIDYDRDFLFTYSGLQQVVDKYLVQDRDSGTLYETPQLMYMTISLVCFSNYDKRVRMSYVKRLYDALSKHKINIPTPIMAGVRTRLKQYASCVLVDVDDTKHSIPHSNSAIFSYVVQRAGIGINMGRCRGINSKINGGEVIHTGVVPFLKMFEATVKSCTQNGIRGGSATVHFPFWHQEIEDIIVLKNNKGTQDNRVRGLDYSIQLSKIFYERFISNGDITLFSPHDVPGLYDAFGSDSFDDLYRHYEQDESVPKKTLSAHQLLLDIVKERSETGRLYIMNVDHCNTHSSFKDQIYMSNLCQEITLPTDPIQHFDDDGGEIALCVLAAINVGKIKQFSEMEELCDLSVRMLDELIDYQDYPVKAAERATRARRSLGIGFIGLAHWLAKQSLTYGSDESLVAVHKLSESLQYFLLKSSNQLAKEKGACDAFHRTKYSDGILPIDTYKSDVDNLVAPEYMYDWESLRSSILEHGLRNSTLTAQMPSESSSVVSNATNGIEPPRGFLSYKVSKKGVLKQIVPQYATLKNNYTLLWDMESNEGYIKLVAVMQKFFDQAISGNWSYNPENYPDNKVPISVIVKDLLNTYKYGWKTSYYHNTYDRKKDADAEQEYNDIISQSITKLNHTEEDDCEACKL